MINRCNGARPLNRFSDIPDYPILYNGSRGSWGPPIRKVCALPLPLDYALCVAIRKVSMAGKRELLLSCARAADKVMPNLVRSIKAIRASIKDTLCIVFRSCRDRRRSFTHILWALFITLSVRGVIYPWNDFQRNGKGKLCSGRRYQSGCRMDRSNGY